MGNFPTDSADHASAHRRASLVSRIVTRPDGSARRFYLWYIRLKLVMDFSLAVVAIAAIMAFALGAAAFFMQVGAYAH